MWGIITGIVKLFGEFFQYLNNQTLINAGKNEQKLEQAAVAEKARDELLNIHTNISTADGDKRRRLRDKWTAGTDN